MQQCDAAEQRLLSGTRAGCVSHRQIQAQLQLTESLLSYHQSGSAWQSLKETHICSSSLGVMLIRILHEGYYAPAFFCCASAKQCSLTPISLFGGFYSQTLVQCQKVQAMISWITFPVVSSIVFMLLEPWHGLWMNITLSFCLHSPFFYAVAQLLIQGKLMRHLVEPGV